MAYTAQLVDKNNEVVYPDVGIPLDNAVWTDEPTATPTTTPWIEGADIKPTAFALPVYFGKVPFVKKTYSNSNLELGDVVDFYKANGVSVSVNNNYFLYANLPSDGQYVAKVRSSLWSSANSWDYMLLEARKNTVTFARAMAPKINGSWGFVNTEGFVPISDGEYLHTFLNTNANNFSDGNMSATDSYMLVEIYKVG